VEELSAQELAAAIHETTNALTVILGWIERARVAAPDNEDAQRSLERAGRYTRDARAAMRRAIGATLPSRPPEQVRSLASRAVEDLAMEAERAHVAIVLDIDDACTELLVPQPDTAWQILTNLLLNGLSVTPRGGEVVLEVACEEEGGLLFRVSDDGPGVPAELRADLFTAGISRRKGGAGIGLRHAHGLAAECDGELRLSNATDEPGGAVFELLWPTADDVAAEDTAVAAKKGDAPRTDLSGARVLLLEDDARVIELLELSLGARGAAVTSVRDAKQLDERLGSDDYDVMLVDLSPLSIEEGEATGLEKAMENARKRNPAIDVVVISGSVAVQPRNDVIWVRKPFEPKELIEAILKGQPGGSQTT
jgi:CheY-like chemotaxis protein